MMGNNILWTDYTQVVLGICQVLLGTTAIFSIFLAIQSNKANNKVHGEENIKISIDFEDSLGNKHSCFLIGPANKLDLNT